MKKNDLEKVIKTTRVEIIVMKVCLLVLAFFMPMYVDNWKLSFLWALIALASIQILEKIIESAVAAILFRVLPEEKAVKAPGARPEDGDGHEV